MGQPGRAGIALYIRGFMRSVVRKADGTGIAGYLIHFITPNLDTAPFRRPPMSPTPSTSKLGVSASGLRAALAALTLAAATLAIGCGGGGLGRCSYDGKSYPAGSTFPSRDGCNTCSCDGSGSLFCTEIACSPLACLYEGTTYMPGDSFPAADGCNTCGCGTDGTIACTKKACPTAESTAWLSLAPVQCNMNPWQLLSSSGDDTAPAYSDPELLTIDNFFEDQKIDLIEIGFLYPATVGGVCTACSCGRGDQLLVRAKAADVATLEKTYGFKLLASSEGPEGGLGYTPRQCNSNPWSAVAKPMTRQEAESAARWLESKGVGVARTGLVFRTSAVVVCDACSCPRGDRLVASATDASAAASLRLLSFGELPR
jgi:hypothetical protein